MNFPPPHPRSPARHCCELRSARCCIWCRDVRRRPRAQPSDTARFAGTRRARHDADNACRLGEAVSPDAVSLNAVVKALAAADHLAPAVDILCRARALGCAITGSTYALMLRLVARAGEHELVARVWEAMQAAGVRSDGDGVSAALLAMVATVRPPRHAIEVARAATRSSLVYWLVWFGWSGR